MFEVNPNVICLIEGETVPCESQISVINEEIPIKINDIEFEGYNKVNLNINSDTEREYTGINNTLQIDINGGILSVDTEKIQGYINTQYEQITNEDFANALLGLGNLIPILGVFGLLAFFFYLIKKIF